MEKKLALRLLNRRCRAKQWYDRLVRFRTVKMFSSCGLDTGAGLQGIGGSELNWVVGRPGHWRGHRWVVAGWRQELEPDEAAYEGELNAIGCWEDLEGRRQLVEVDPDDVAVWMRGGSQHTVSVSDVCRAIENELKETVQFIQLLFYILPLVDGLMQKFCM